MFLSKCEDNFLDDGMKINIRLHNYPESMIALKNLKAAYIGKFNFMYAFFFCPQTWMRKYMNGISFGDMTDKLVSVRGTVVKVSNVRPLVVQMNFNCAKCKYSILRIFPDGKFSPPTVCSLNGCKSRTFNPIRSSARAIDFQKIR